jgi:hypothetical protein
LEDAAAKFVAGFLHVVFRCMLFCTTALTTCKAFVPILDLATTGVADANRELLQVSCHLLSELAKRRVPEMLTWLQLNLVKVVTTTVVAIAISAPRESFAQSSNLLLVLMELVGTQTSTSCISAALGHEALALPQVSDCERQEFGRGLLQTADPRAFHGVCKKMAGAFRR